MGNNIFVQNARKQEITKLAKKQYINQSKGLIITDIIPESGYKKSYQAIGSRINFKAEEAALLGRLLP